MDKFGGPDFHAAPVWQKELREIDHLQESFKHMADEITSLMERIQEREKQKRALEVNLSPGTDQSSFFISTLFSIRCAVRLEKMNRQPKCSIHLLICSEAL